MRRSVSPRVAAIASRARLYAHTRQRSRVFYVFCVFSAIFSALAAATRETSLLLRASSPYSRWRRSARAAASLLEFCYMRLYEI